MVKSAERKVNIFLRIRETTKNEFEELAIAQDLNISDLLRILIHRYINEEKAKEGK